MKKRIFSIVLSLCMVLALVPAMAFAANDDASRLQNMLDSGGTVKLDKDYTIDTTLEINNTVTIDLNGHVIKMTGSGSVITVGSSGNLTMTDSSPNTTHEDSSLPSGGVITGGNAGEGDGGGVNIVDGGTFTMTGGNIAGCTAREGGGVHVEKDGTFTMTGGSIIGCRATTASEGTNTYGGGICNFGTTKLSGNAVIRNCHVEKADYGYEGGGVFSSGPSLEISENVEITGCTANKSSYAIRVNADATNNFLISGGTFGGSVYLLSSGERGSVIGGIFYGDINGAGNINGNKVTFKIDDSEYAVGIVQSGSKATAPAEPTKDGYSFTGWHTDKELTKKYSFESLVNEDITLYAGFGYTVTYKSGDEGTGSIEAGGKTLGVDFTLSSETFTREGYVQTGWIDKENNQQYSLGGLYTTDADVTLYPVWEKIYTFEAPFATTVKQAGNVAPGETTFDLQVIGSDGEKVSSDDVEIEADSVTTNGEGTYTGTVTIKGTYEDIWTMLSDKVYVKQAGVDDPDWTVDDTVWGLSMKEAAAMAVSDNSDGAAEYSVLIFPAEYYETDNGGYYEMVDGAYAATEMTFTNTYTKSAADPSDDEAKTDAEDSAKTGDNTNLALLIALMILSVAGISGTAVYTRRKRVR